MTDWTCGTGPRVHVERNEWCGLLGKNPKQILRHRFTCRKLAEKYERQTLLRSEKNTSGQKEKWGRQEVAN